MADIVAVTALVVSILTAVFVIVGQGFGLTLGYRESEATSKRKRDIDEGLKKDLMMREQQYREQEHTSKSNGETSFGMLEELGRCAFLTRSLTTSMLESMTRHIKSGLRNLAGGIVMLAIVILAGLFGDFSYSPQQVTGSGYVIMFFGLVFLAFFANSAYGELRKHLKLREDFVTLSENPSLEYSEQLFSKLRAANLF